LFQHGSLGGAEKQGPGNLVKQKTHAGRREGESASNGEIIGKEKEIESFLQGALGGKKGRKGLREAGVEGQTLRHWQKRRRSISVLAGKGAATAETMGRNEPSVVGREPKQIKG